MSSFTSSFERKCLLMLAVGIAAALLACAAGAEWFLRATILPRDLFWKQVDLFFSTSNVDAAFGDSQMARGFAGTPTLVNLAYPADSILQVETKIKSFYASKKPGRVILEAAPQLLSALRLEDFPRDYDKIFTEGQRRYVPFGLAIMDGYYRSRIVAYLRHENPEDHTEFVPTGGLMTDINLAETFNARDWKYIQILLQKRLSLHAPAPGFEKTDFAGAYRDIVSWLTKRGASVCMVTMPVMPVYRETMLRMNYKDRFDAGFAFFDALARENGVKYISYWDAFDDPTLFLNDDHLNRKGAMKLTPKLMADCFGEKP